MYVEFMGSVWKSSKIINYGIFISIPFHCTHLKVSATIFSSEYVSQAPFLLLNAFISLNEIIAIVFLPLRLNFRILLKSTHFCPFFFVRSGLHCFHCIEKRAKKKEITLAKAFQMHKSGKPWISFPLPNKRKEKKKSISFIN